MARFPPPGGEPTVARLAYRWGMPPPDPPTPALALVAAPDAPLGAADPGRRWALRVGQDRPDLFPGVAPDEADEVIPALLALPPGRWGRTAVEVALPVVLSDGAGPYLLDARGRLVLALAPHPRVPGVRVAMGEAAPAHRIGAVRPPAAGRLWAWVCAADIAPAERVEALDELDAAATVADLTHWEARMRARGAGVVG